MNILEVMQRWPSHEAAMRHLEKVRWGGRPTCPYCNSTKVCSHASKDKTLPRWQCEECSRAFSATVGTIFHHTHLPLNKWFLALAIMLNAKKNVSNAQLGRDLGLPYKTAWSLALRIRTAMFTDPEQNKLFHGIVEMDEVYIGGKPRKGNTGSSGGGNNKRGRGTKKLPVVGIAERHGRVIARAFDKTRLTQKNLTKFYKRHVDRIHYKTATGLKHMVLSVKGGKLTPAHVRELRGVLERESDAQLAGLITLQTPTKGMKSEATDGEMFEYDGKKYPRIQIRTVDDLLSKRGFETPSRVETLSWERQGALPL